MHSYHGTETTVLSLRSRTEGGDGTAVVWRHRAFFVGGGMALSHHALGHHLHCRTVAYAPWAVFGGVGGSTGLPHIAPWCAYDTITLSTLAEFHPLYS